MPLAPLRSFDNLLACPRCKEPLERGARGNLRCTSQTCSIENAEFPAVGGCDLLVDFQRSVVDREALLESSGESVIERRPWKELLQRVVDGGNRFAPHFAEDIVARLEQCETQTPTLLVIGGGQIGSGSHALYGSQKVRIIALDVYLSPHVNIIGDAHHLPLRDESIDGVWIQSVLEHVTKPELVVAELHRVLRSDGLVFADTSFLWPVCEEAFDFQRFSASAHRWLFRNFELIAAGSSSGPGTVAAVALRYLLQSLLRSTRLGQIAAFPFSALRLLDRFCDNRRAIDGAGGTFLYARKTGQRFTESHLVDYYAEQPRFQAKSRPLRR
jgi:hypothetical protein